MRGLAGISAFAFILIFLASCSKKDTTPAATTGTPVVNYTVAYSLYSLQSKFLFIYTDINGSHTDTIYTQTDSIITQVPTGSDMQVMQKIECLDQAEPDQLIIKAYMNGSSISNSNSKPGAGPLVVGVELQSLL